MKTAFCFSGELRSIDKTYPLLKEKIMDRFSNYDIFYHTWKDDPDLNKLHYFENDNHTKNIIVENRVTLDEKKYNKHLINNTKVQPLLRQLYGLEQVNNLKKEQEKQNGFSYDIVFRIRPDILVCNNTSLEKGVETWDMKDYVYTTDHDDYGGYNDKFYFSNSVNMDILSNRRELMDYYVSIGGLLHYEKFLKFSIDYSGLKLCRTSMLFTLLRTNGNFSGQLEDNKFIKINLDNS